MTNTPLTRQPGTNIVLTGEQTKHLMAAITDVLHDNYVGLTLRIVLRSQETTKDFIRHLKECKLSSDDRHVAYHNIIQGGVSCGLACEEIIERFCASLFSLETGNEMEIHCSCFADALYKLGGGASMSAKSLKEEWSRAARSVGCGNFLKEAVL